MLYGYLGGYKDGERSDGGRRYPKRSGDDARYNYRGGRQERDGEREDGGRRHSGGSRDDARYDDRGDRQHRYGWEEGSRDYHHSPDRHPYGRGRGGNRGRGGYRGRGRGAPSDRVPAHGKGRRVQWAPQEHPDGGYSRCFGHDDNRYKERHDESYYGRNTYGNDGSFRRHNNWRGRTSRGIRSGQHRQQAIAAASANNGQGTLGATSAAINNHAAHAAVAPVTVPTVVVPPVAPTPTAPTPTIPTAAPVPAIHTPAPAPAVHTAAPVSAIQTPATAPAVHTPAPAIQTKALTPAVETQAPTLELHTPETATATVTPFISARVAAEPALQSPPSPPPSAVVPSNSVPSNTNIPLTAVVNPSSLATEAEVGDVRKAVHNVIPSSLEELRERFLKEVTEVVQKFPMPRFDTYNKGNPIPLLDFVLAHQKLSPGEFNHWSWDVFETLETQSEALAQGQIFHDRLNMSGHSNFTHFVRWVNESNKNEEHNPYTTTLLMDLNRFHKQYIELRSRMEKFTWLNMVEARNPGTRSRARVETDRRLDERAATIALQSRDRGGPSTAVIKKGSQEPTTTGEGSGGRKNKATRNGGKEREECGNNEGNAAVADSDQRNGTKVEKTAKDADRSLMRGQKLSLAAREACGSGSQAVANGAKKSCTNIEGSVKVAGKCQQRAKASSIQDHGEDLSANNKGEHTTTAVHEDRRKEGKASASRQAQKNSGKDGVQRITERNVKGVNKDKLGKQK